MKQEIIRKALVLLGSNSGNYERRQSGTATSKAKNLCEEFISSSIEEVLLSIKWDFALKLVDKIEVDTSGFKIIPNIEDCLSLLL